MVKLQALTFFKKTTQKLERTENKNLSKIECIIILSEFPFISHGNPDNNFESLCITSRKYSLQSFLYNAVAKRDLVHHESDRLVSRNV
jgi:hypothetical protein